MTAASAVVVAATALVGCASGGAADGSPEPDIIGPLILGAPPLCEASGAIRAPWDPRLVLVADNEIRDRLFRFRVGADDGLLEADGELLIPADKAPEDLEGLAKLAEQLVLVGSHGRGGSCTPKPRRQRIQALIVDPVSETVVHSSTLDSSPSWSLDTSTVDACLGSFFPEAPPQWSTEFCRALVHNEHPTDLHKCRCFDIEGAVGIADENGVPRMWIGLRQPRVNDGAVLLRLAHAAGKLQFDRVALIPVNRGIRALAEHDGHLWAILGPAPPAYATSCLWRVPLASLRNDTVLHGEVVVHGLPPASEGMVFSPDRVVVVIDGEQAPAPGEACVEPARQVVVPLP